MIKERGWMIKSLQEVLLFFFFHNKAITMEPFFKEIFVPGMPFSDTFYNSSVLFCFFLTNGDLPNENHINAVDACGAWVFVLFNEAQNVSQMSTFTIK